jgi:NAD(P)-dependent dehydrogenase (short-subunit alcohol dehydrogenase family)
MGKLDDATYMSSPPALRFDGMVAWITGASRGLGRSLALAMAGAGADLILSARNCEPLEELQAQVADIGVRAQVVAGSVTDPKFATAAVQKAEAEFGRLDVLINNAGISPYFKRAEHLTQADLNEVIATNTVGPFGCSVAALPLLEKSSHPSVVNISSVHGKRAFERLAAYATSKGGLEMLTRSLAVEWAGKGIRVNSLAPGYIDTDMTLGLRENPRWNEAVIGQIPLGRFASTAEIVACAMFLASPISSYVTGATLAADGGWSAR